jgi:hypothetical protein
MADTSSSSRFKTDMPQIPGVAPSKPRRRNPLLSLILGFAVVGVLILLSGRWLTHSHTVEPVRVEPAAQIEVPPAPPDPSASLPHADEKNPAIANIADFAQPWSSADFFVKNRLTGENIPATIVRLPGGSAASASSYWAFSRKAPYGSCLLEYVSDLDKLRTEYDYRAAKHPLVGNPCSRTLYDPMKTANLPGDIWIRGGIVQGSDLRPPFGVEIEIQDKQILAIRSE